MKFYLDSADPDDIAWAAQSGFVTGITVNQTLLAKGPKLSLANALDAILQAADDLSVSFPLTAKDLPALHEQAGAYEEIVRPHQTLYLKLPVSRETLPAIRQLSAKGHDINATCIYTGVQAALAEQAGAAILSIFVGRINDEHPGWGWKTLSAARAVCGAAVVLAGSIRDKTMVAGAIDHGAHIVTASRKVLETLADDPGTQRSLAKFNADLEAWKA